MCRKLVALLTVSLSGVLLTGCSFAPFSNNYAAHTIEHKAISIQGGLADVTEGEIPYVRLGYGLTENLELGLLSEYQFADFVTGVVVKYGFFNNKEAGASFSIEGSAGGGGSSSYAYFAPSIGYKQNRWDVYFSPKYSFVRFGYDDFKLDFGGVGELDLSGKSSVNYGTVTAGNTFWMTKKFGLNLNVNYAFGSIEGVYGGAGFVYVFK